MRVCLTDHKIGPTHLDRILHTPQVVGALCDYRTLSLSCPLFLAQLWASLGSVGSLQGMLIYRMKQSLSHCHCSCRSRGQTNCSLVRIHMRTNNPLYRYAWCKIKRGRCKLSSLSFCLYQLVYGVKSLSAPAHCVTLSLSFFCNSLARYISQYSRNCV